LAPIENAYVVGHRQ